MTTTTKCLCLLAAALFAVTAASQTQYTVEVVEQVQPSSSVSARQNEREDYAITYSYNQGPPTTISVIGGKRRTHEGFVARSINVHGQMCGALRLESGTYVGVIWDPKTGFTELEGGQQAWPFFINDRGDVGGAIGFTPCLWRDGAAIRYPTMMGRVVLVLEESDMVLGYWADAHAAQAWIGDTAGNGRRIQPELAAHTQLSRRLVLGHVNYKDFGAAYILDLDTRKTGRMWYGGAHTILSINSSLVAVGTTYHDIWWGSPRPSLWVPTGHLQWEHVDPLLSMPGNRWTFLQMLHITDAGVILAFARYANGPLLLIRMRPIG